MKREREMVVAARTQHCYMLLLLLHGGAVRALLLTRVSDSVFTMGMARMARFLGSGHVLGKLQRQSWRHVRSSALPASSC
jgi:hypothetical protein